MALTQDYDNVPRKFFGGAWTPKSVGVDLCVHPTDRNRPLMIGCIRCRTYKGKITKDEMRRIKFALDEIKADAAIAWFPRYGWIVVARRGNS